MSDDVWQEATAYTVCAVPRSVPGWDAFAVNVEQRYGIDVDSAWAVTLRGTWVWDAGVDGVAIGWVLDPIPSERSDGHLRRCRFARLADALDVAREVAPTVEVNGRFARTVGAIGGRS